MIKLDHGQVLIALLGLGAADLAALNLWALPGVFTVTEIDAASDGTQVQAAAPTAVALPNPPPMAAAAPAPAPAPVAAAPAPAEHEHDAAATARKPAPATPAAVAVEAAEANTVILFGRGTWWVGRKGRAALRSSLAGLSRERVVVEIDGHADAAGPQGLNQRISQERAQAVAAVLRHTGLAADQIHVRAFGERSPSHDGRSRRVEIRIRGAP